MKSTKTLFAATLFAACALSQPALAQSPQPTVSTMAALEKSDIDFAFEKTAQPVRVAALSEKEMKETEGAFINFFIGAGAGAAGGIGAYLVTNWFGNQPFTQKGLLYAATTGALTGAVGAPLIAASGGGLLANVAWRPSIIASNVSFNQYSNYRGW